MRARTGCQACRERHIKCVRENQEDKCQKCIENDRACFQTARHRFRPVTSVNLKTDDDRTVKQNLTYDATQRWVDIPQQVEFVGSNSSRAAIPADTQSLPDTSEVDHDIDVEEHVLTTEDFATSAELERLNSAQSFGWPTASETQTVLRTTTTNAKRAHYSPEPVSALLTSPSRLSHHSHTHSQTRIFSPTSLTNPLSPPLTSNPSWPFTSAREARYFAHYINELSPWVDSCDKFQHFGKEVPMRAPHYPIIANAIYALSSRHICMLNNTEDSESPHYAAKCVQLLIKSMDDPFAHWDENLLAAVVIMRLHEELSQDDDLRCHLFGTRKILDSISAFAADGGLRESASWVSLRQHIYICLTEQQPLEIKLQSFRHSAVFNESSNTPEDWANRMVFLFATVLDYAFAPQEHTENETPRPERWQELRLEVENWYNTKPWYFSPLWEDKEPGANVVSTPASVPAVSTTPQDPPPFISTYTSTTSSYPLKPWPELLYAHRPQVTGMQYYHLARVVLAIYDPELTRLGFGSHRARKNSERVVVDGLRNIVGLAATNEHYVNTFFEASHILRACGGYLREEAEQNAAIVFLERAEQKLGWRTGKTIQELRNTWANA